MLLSFAAAHAAYKPSRCSGGFIFLPLPTQADPYIHIRFVL